METMKAIRIHSYGGRDVLVHEDAPVPEIGSDEILVKVQAAGVNPIDWKVREGYAKDFLRHRLPLIPGWDVSGTVAEAGSAVKTFKTGDEVFAFLDLNRGGGYAEYVVVKESEAAFKPASLDHYQAAAVPLAALTAWQSLFDIAGLGAGQRVLIHAAAGGVGHFAVQFARWGDAHAIGTASAPNHDFLLSIGAHEVIDYTRVAFAEVVREVDVVLDTLGGSAREQSWGVLKKNGILVTTLPPAPLREAEKHGMRAADMLVRPDGGQLGEIGELIDGGHVRPVIQEVLPLVRADRAQEISQAGHVRGKIVLSMV